MHLLSYCSASPGGQRCDQGVGGKYQVESKRVEECTLNGTAQTTGPWGPLSLWLCLSGFAASLRLPVLSQTDSSVLLDGCQSCVTSAPLFLSNVGTAVDGADRVSVPPSVVVSRSGRRNSRVPAVCERPCLTAASAVWGLAAGTRTLLGWQRNPVWSVRTKTQVDVLWKSWRTLRSFHGDTMINDHTNIYIWTQLCAHGASRNAVYEHHSLTSVRQFHPHQSVKPVFRTFLCINSKG